MWKFESRLLRDYLFGTSPKSFEMTIKNKSYLITNSDQLEKLDSRYDDLDWSHLDFPKDREFNLNPLISSRYFLPEPLEVSDDPEPLSYITCNRDDTKNSLIHHIFYQILYIVLYMLIYSGIIQNIYLKIFLIFNYIYYLNLFGINLQLAAAFKIIPEWCGYVAPTIWSYQNRKWELLYDDWKDQEVSNQWSVSTFGIAQTLDDLDEMIEENPETFWQLLRKIFKFKNIIKYLDEELCFNPMMNYNLFVTYLIVHFVICYLFLLPIYEYCIGASLLIHFGLVIFNVLVSLLGLSITIWIGLLIKYLIYVPKWHTLTPSDDPNYLQFWLYSGISLLELTNRASGMIYNITRSVHWPAWKHSPGQIWKKHFDNLKTINQCYRDSKFRKIAQRNQISIKERNISSEKIIEELEDELEKLEEFLEKRD